MQTLVSVTFSNKNTEMDNEVGVCSNGRLCSLVVKVPGYRSLGLGSVPDATRFSEK
jgi:hypothetical protein